MIYLYESGYQRNYVTTDENGRLNVVIETMNDAIGDMWEPDIAIYQGYSTLEEANLDAINSVPSAGTQYSFYDAARRTLTLMHGN